MDIDFAAAIAAAQGIGCYENLDEGTEVLVTDVWGPQRNQGPRVRIVVRTTTQDYEIARGLAAAMARTFFRGYDVLFVSGSEQQYGFRFMFEREPLMTVHFPPFEIDG
jgi:hypothetical protein